MTYVKKSLPSQALWINIKKKNSIYDSIGSPMETIKIDKATQGQQYKLIKREHLLFHKVKINHVIYSVIYEYFKFLLI